MRGADNNLDRCKTRGGVIVNICHLTDCMEFMKTLPDNAFDLAIVDPPYGIGDFSTAADGRKGIQRTNWKYSWNEDTPNSKYFNELYRISVNQIIWGANYYGGMVRDVGRIIFDKTDGGTAGLNFSDMDLASHSFGVNIKVFRHKWMGIMKGKGSTSESRIHPCQKPVALYKWLLKNYAKPGQTIFDSHVGSGSIRIACHDMGYDFTGCEIDADYHAAQEKRFQTHIAQNQLFEPAELTAEYHQESLL